jgi:hypothetical protein
MKRNSMYFDTHGTKINQEDYRPGFRIIRFIKSVWYVIIRGESPVTSGRTPINKPYRH